MVVVDVAWCVDWTDDDSLFLGVLALVVCLFVTKAT